MPLLRIPVFTLLLLLAAAGCRSKKDLKKTPEVKKEVKKESGSAVQEKLGISSREIKGSKLYRFVDDWYGVPYKYGGCQKSGVDCSCFAGNLYQQVYDHKIPRSAGDIYKDCDKVNIEKIKEGDLVFFKINSSSISHVGVYLKDSKFAHASTSKGVIISDLNETYYKKYFYSAGRLKHSS